MAEDPMTAAFLEGHRLKGLAIRSLDNLDLYRQAAGRFHEAGQLANQAEMDPASDDQARQGARVFGPYYLYEEQRCLTSYFYEKRDTAKATEHLQTAHSLLSEHVDRLEQNIKTATPKGSAKLSSILATARYYQRDNAVWSEAILGRAAWDEGRFIDALDRYRRMARRHEELIENAKGLSDPAYERIAQGNFIGAMANCSSAIVGHHLAMTHVEDGQDQKTIPDDLAHELLRHTLQAYRYGMAASDVNPEWAQYRKGAILCRSNIEEFLKDNKNRWETLFARFMDEPEFLKIMAGVDLALFKSLTRIGDVSSSSEREASSEDTPADQAKLETQRLLRLLFCILDRGTGSSDETQLFDGMSHEQLVRTFTEYLNQHRHYIGYCHIEQSHALNDRGVDIILQAQGGKIGFQIKSHFDVRQEDFAANVKRQFAESFAHGLDHYIILICCPLRKEGKVDLSQKVSHLLNELSSMKTEYHSAYGPLNTVRYFMGLPTLSRDELLLRRAIESGALHEFEKGYEHLPGLDDEEVLFCLSRIWKIAPFGLVLPERRFHHEQRTSSPFPPREGRRRQAAPA